MAGGKSQLSSSHAGAGSHPGPWPSLSPAARRLGRGHSQNQSSAKCPQNSSLHICWGSEMMGFGEGGHCSNFPLLSTHLILQANPFQPYGALASQTCTQEAPAAAAPLHPVTPREQRFGPQKQCMVGKGCEPPHSPPGDGLSQQPPNRLRMHGF